MKNRVSMQDIADKVGVSKVTVSKVLRGQSDVSESMRDKVLETAKELGYVYKGSTQQECDISKIIVMTPEHFLGRSDSFYIKLFKVLSEKLDKLGIDTKLVIVDTESEKELIVPDAVKNRAADGLIVLGQFSRKYLKNLVSYELPLIFLDFYYDGFDVPSIITDNFFGAYEITNALIKKGHRRIGFVGNINSTSSIQDRYLGYYKALLEYNIPLNPKWILNDRTEDGITIDIELPDEMPTAFVCNCDEIALSLVNKLKRHGYRIPEDISIAGFDDTAHSKLCDPPITTVHISLDEMANMAIRTIMKKINKNTANNNRMLVKGKIVNRKSLAAPRD
ncbi:LacI family DNA-binding transcriptional regulator [[Clostridium] cellulosi]